MLVRRHRHLVPTIAAAAQRDRWINLTLRSGLTEAQAQTVIRSESFGPLTAELRRADAHHFDVEVLLPRLIRCRTLGDAADVGAVLVSRLRHTVTDSSGHRAAPDLVAGLIPAARGPMDADMREALDDRAHLIAARSRALVQSAMEAREPWLTKLGSPPEGPPERTKWLTAAATVAAYRDRWHVDGSMVTGRAGSDLQRLETARASQAIRQARAVADTARPIAESTPASGSRLSRRSPASDVLADISTVSATHW
ncbi:hypothetical protein [Aeromicrobium sp.]|uniref:hypothetical protein n=1 Tax=Aeromicrobium sp. TaxID=1871063 RepID=UPI0028A83CA2|nr:hypothetical protein [Aeromicrobium sp.]